MADNTGRRQRLAVFLIAGWGGAMSAATAQDLNSPTFAPLFLAQADSAPLTALGRRERNVATPTPVVPDSWWAVPAAQTPAAAQAPVSPAAVSTTAVTDVDDAPTKALPPFRDTPNYARGLTAITDKQSTSMLQELEALEEDYAGDADFDYVYGVALLDNGRPQEALYALLRASQQRPQGLGIRLDLGRAYYEAQENESARVVFEQLARRNPPPQAAQVIESYLKAIGQRAGRYERRLEGVISVLGGFDTNANSASNLQSFAGFILDEQAQGQDSGYAGLAAQAEYAHPLSPRWYWISSAQLLDREYFDSPEFSTLSAGVSTGLRYRLGDSEWNAQVGGRQVLVDGSNNGRQVMATLGLNQTLSSFWSYRLNTRLTAQRYDQAVRIRDVDQLLLATGVVRRTRWAHGGEFGVDLIAGRDEARDDASPYGRDLFGASLSGVVQITPRWRLNLTQRYLDAQYEGQFFGVDRGDLQLASEMHLQFSDARWQNWSVGLTAQYTDNQSDIDIYDYERTDVWLSINRRLD